MYQPGVNPILTAKQIALSTSGIKRLLDDDEFAYYYNFLNSEVDLDERVKLAIAVVLKADLIRFYKNYDDFKDPLIEELTEKYKNLSANDKLIADSEIFAFDSYLATPLPPTSTMEQEVNSRQNIFFTHREKEEKRVSEELSIQENLEKQQREHQMLAAKNIDEEKTLKNEWSKFIAQNFSEFLHAIFVDHPISQQMNEFRAEEELNLRAQVASLLGARKLNGSQSLRVYADGLNILLSPDETLAKENIKKLINKYGRMHPITRMLF